MDQKEFDQLLKQSNFLKDLERELNKIIIVINNLETRIIKLESKK